MERVEDIPADCFGGPDGQLHVQIGERLVACVAHVNRADLPDSAREITCLRIRDDLRELCYPVRSGLDIGDVPAMLDMVSPRGVVAGLVLLDDWQIELIYGLAVLAGGSNVYSRSWSSRVIIAESDALWTP